jgi:hypothetical protein
MYKKWALTEGWKQRREMVRRGIITSNTPSVSYSSDTKHGLHESSIGNELLVLANRGINEMSQIEDKFPGIDLTQYLRELKKAGLITLASSV